LYSDGVGRALPRVGGGGRGHRRRRRFLFLTKIRRKKRSRDVLRASDDGARLCVARRPLLLLLLTDHVRRRAVSAVAVGVAAGHRPDDRRVHVMIAVGRTRGAHLKRRRETDHQDGCGVEF